jgi:hypothetical protein
MGAGLKPPPQDAAVGAGTRGSDPPVPEPTRGPRRWTSRAPGGRITGVGGRATPGEEARAAGRAARPRGSPACEEVKQRVLLLLSAGRHGRAGFAARRRCSRDARGRLVHSPYCPQVADSVPIRSWAKTPRSLPGVATRPFTGLCGPSPAANESPARSRHVAEAGP